ncbi:hypothetical protein [Streptomyces xanthochromogenes]|uniref:hypothetical protein n=1 Tax=Streptomyces xanthochromogenes TaxID=67384 RepID=UPI002F403D67
MFFDQAIVRVRASTRTDRGGNTVPDWTISDRDTFNGVNVQPNGSPGVGGEDVTEDRDAITTGWRVQSAPGHDLDVKAIDRIEWDGLTLEVAGEVARWTDPTDGSLHHVEFTITRSTG